MRPLDASDYDASMGPERAADTRRPGSVRPASSDDSPKKPLSAVHAAVLEALCSTYPRNGAPDPAQRVPTYGYIAAELKRAHDRPMGEGTIKGYLTELYDHFEVPEDTRGRKRFRLVQLTYERNLLGVWRPEEPPVQISPAASETHGPTEYDAHGGVGQSAGGAPPRSGSIDFDPGRPAGPGEQLPRLDDDQQSRGERRLPRLTRARIIIGAILVVASVTTVDQLRSSDDASDADRPARGRVGSTPCPSGHACVWNGVYDRASRAFSADDAERWVHFDKRKLSIENHFTNRAVRSSNGDHVTCLDPGEKKGGPAFDGTVAIYIAASGTRC